MVSDLPGIFLWNPCEAALHCESTESTHPYRYLNKYPRQKVYMLDWSKSPGGLYRSRGHRIYRGKHLIWDYKSMKYLFFYFIFIRISIIFLKLSLLQKKDDCSWCEYLSETGSQSEDEIRLEYGYDLKCCLILILLPLVACCLVASPCVVLWVFSCNRLKTTSEIVHGKSVDYQGFDVSHCSTFSLGKYQ